MKNKYNIPDYWRQKIHQNESFWDGLFESQPITPRSVIINPVILNPFTNQAEDAWAVYPNPQSVIGYLKYFYLPTAFIGMIEEEMDNRYYFSENLLEMLAELKEEHMDKVDLIEEMESCYLRLDALWDDDDNWCMEALTAWAAALNEQWQAEDHGMVLSIHLFRSPEETMKYIMKSYEAHIGIEQLEHDLGFSQEELIQIASDDIFQNDFMKRKFTDLLTNRLAITM